jgi:hypothetical protein
LVDVCTLRVKPVAVFVAVTVAPLAGVESAETCPRIVAPVDWARTCGAATSMQLASPQASNVRLSLRDALYLDFMTSPLPGPVNVGQLPSMSFYDVP